MSWASRRRTEYLMGVFIVVFLVVGIPIAYAVFSKAPTCFDGIQNQGETAPDMGGPCLRLDPNHLLPYAVMWSRSFRVRDGSYTAVAYIENPNANAGVQTAHYDFGLFDSSNVEIAERSGVTPILPGGITPVLLTGIDTGNRIVVHTYFQITDPTLEWDRMSNPGAAITVDNTNVSSSDSGPRVDAQVHNTSPAGFSNVPLVSVVFDTAGNALAASGTIVPSLPAASAEPVTFTWPDQFSSSVGRVDIIPVMQPVPQQVSAAN